MHYRKCSALFYVLVYIWQLTLISHGFVLVYTMPLAGWVSETVRVGTACLDNPSTSLYCVYCGVGLGQLH